MSLRTIPIHRSLHRTNTFMGGDREVVMMAGLIAIASIAVGQSLFSIVMGVVFWFMILIPSRMLNKSDPIMRKVFLADLKFRQRYFPAHTHVLANPVINYKTAMTKSGCCYKG